MEIIKGKSIVKGVAIGKIRFYSKQQQQVVRHHVEDPDAEIKRFQEAREATVEQLHGLYHKALKEVGEVNAAIFDVHAMLAEDDDFNESILNIITGQRLNAEYAVATTGDNFAEMFANMDDDYFKARSADMKDISDRILGNLTGRAEGDINSDQPVILAAEDLAPSETVSMDKSTLLAFVTHLGSTNSHTAILARTMNIPALIGVEVTKDWNGKLAIVDGIRGQLILDPDEETLAKQREVQKKLQHKRELLTLLKGKAAVTKDGKHIRLYANIGNVSDMADVMENGADGIGLFRSEFLYLESEGYPTQEQQFKAYRTVAEMMAGKKVIIRTLDIGADKQAEYFQLEREENPAMGFRAIRICLERRDIFKTQLRAILRASAYGNIGIMYPMIISVEEVRTIKKIFAQVKEELVAQGIPVGEVEQGVMIETPAAVMISDELAKEVDFFSIGTNDLTQYTLAVDRQNAKLEKYYDPRHPAILRMIKMVIDNGHKENCWVGICGELGADEKLTETFLKMGLDELSVSASGILPLKEIIRNTTIE